MLRDENQVQIFTRKPIKIDTSNLHRGHTTFANALPAVKQYLCLIALSVGFEQSSMMAIDLLADVLMRYIMNLARSFVSHSLKFENSINSLHRCLYDNGTSANLIWNYLYENYSYSRKLISVNTKLGNILRGIRNTIGDEDIYTGDDGFVAGGLINNVLEEDMFGLESIGLGGVKIPEKLLKRKANNIVESKSFVVYESLPLYRPIDAMSNVGIYRPFLSFLEEIHSQEQQSIPVE
eukprot:NODE_99_length_20944_cov_0.552746.p7 type:complete len:236 gc:universal NODE_99_length_20944_cov_0.552746:19605-18898(-)